MNRYILISFILLSSCNRESGLNEQLSTMLNKEIVFEDSVHNTKKLFTVVHYVDSIGCIPCKLRPQDWITFQGRIDSLYNNNVKIVFVSHVNALRDLRKLMVARNLYNIEVLPDSANKWKNGNQIGDNQLFYTMLLDSENKVLVVGEPFLNKKMIALYDNAIIKRK